MVKRYFYYMDPKTMILIQATSSLWIKSCNRISIIEILFFRVQAQHMGGKWSLLGLAWSFSVSFPSSYFKLYGKDPTPILHLYYTYHTGVKAIYLYDIIYVACRVYNSFNTIRCKLHRAVYVSNIRLSTSIFSNNLLVILK